MKRSDSVEGYILLQMQNLFFRCRMAPVSWLWWRRRRQVILPSWQLPRQTWLHADLVEGRRLSQQRLGVRKEKELGDPTFWGFEYRECCSCSYQPFGSACNIQQKWLILQLTGKFPASYWTPKINQARMTWTGAGNGVGAALSAAVNRRCPTARQPIPMTPFWRATTRAAAMIWVCTDMAKKLKDRLGDPALKLRGSHYLPFDFLDISVLSIFQQLEKN